MSQEDVALFYRWYGQLKQHRKGFPALGTIAGALVVLERLKETPSCLIQDHIATGKAQIKGAGGQAVKRILEAHGETRPFLSEGGRTNRGLRGDIERMLVVLEEVGLPKLCQNERHNLLDAWQAELVRKVRDFHNTQRLKFEYVSALTTAENISNLLQSAAEQLKEGMVAQYLVGAKLQLRFPEIEIGNESYSTSDVQSGRFGDFLIGDTAFHVTVAPLQSHYDKCSTNLKAGVRPFLLVPKRIEPGDENLLRNMSLTAVMVGNIETFVATNVEEISKFDSNQAAVELAQLLQIYNKRVDAVEFDKSLMVEIPRNLLSKLH